MSWPWDGQRIGGGIWDSNQGDWKGDKANKCVLQTAKSKFILYPYYAALFGGLAGTSHTPTLLLVSWYTGNKVLPNPAFRRPWTLRRMLGRTEGWRIWLICCNRFDVHDGPHGAGTQDLVRQGVDSRSLEAVLERGVARRGGSVGMDVQCIKKTMKHFIPFEVRLCDLVVSGEHDIDQHAQSTGGISIDLTRIYQVKRSTSSCYSPKDSAHASLCDSSSLSNPILHNPANTTTTSPAHPSYLNPPFKIPTTSSSNSSMPSPSTISSFNFRFLALPAELTGLAYVVLRLDNKSNPGAADGGAAGCWYCTMFSIPACCIPFPPAELNPALAP